MSKRTSTATKSPSRVKNRRSSASAGKPDTTKRPGGKLNLILERLEKRTGATLEDLVAATSWQRHSVHGALSRLRTGGFPISLDTKAGRKAYRIVRPEA